MSRLTVGAKQSRVAVLSREPSHALPAELQCPASMEAQLAAEAMARGDWETAAQLEEEAPCGSR